MFTPSLSKTKIFDLAVKMKQFWGILHQFRDTALSSFIKMGNLEFFVILINGSSEMIYET